MSSALDLVMAGMRGQVRIISRIRQTIKGNPATDDCKCGDKMTPSRFYEGQLQCPSCGRVR